DTAQQPNVDALGAKLVGLAPDRRLEEAEQAHDLVVGPGPVLAAERVQGQDLDPAPNGMPQEAPDRLDAGRMALQLRYPALAGPAPVAVHDDRDVARQLGSGRCL